MAAPPTAVSRPVRRPAGAWGAALVAVAAVAAVVALRGADLARGRTLTARGERTWHAWVVRQPRLLAQLEAVAVELPPGARVHLVVPPATDGVWLATLAPYYLPAQYLGAVVPRGTTFPTMAGDWVVTLDPRAAQVRRVDQSSATRDQWK